MAVGRGCLLGNLPCARMEVPAHWRPGQELWCCQALSWHPARCWCLTVFLMEEHPLPLAQAANSD